MQLHADGAVKAHMASVPAQQGHQGWPSMVRQHRQLHHRPLRGWPRVSVRSQLRVHPGDDAGTTSAPNPRRPRSSPHGSWRRRLARSSGATPSATSPPRPSSAPAISAIADAGYTDPGACNPVRNFRLPGSINLQTRPRQFRSPLGRVSPRARIHAWTRSAPPWASRQSRPTRSPCARSACRDDGADDVMAWLSEQGLLLSKPNGEGWAGVICPNSAEHTDGNPEGRYMPANRAYCCLHSHCVDFDSRLFLQWVADNGGPAHTPACVRSCWRRPWTRRCPSSTPTQRIPRRGRARHCRS